MSDSDGGCHTLPCKACSGGFLPFPCVRHALSARNYVLSDKAASALSDLIKHFRQEEDVYQQGPTLSEELASDLKAATNCLKIVREEAKSDLQVK